MSDVTPALALAIAVADEPPSDSTPGSHPVYGDAGVPQRQCGRCRSVFDGDPTQPVAALPEWWLCPECRPILTPRADAERARRVSSAEARLAAPHEH